MGLQFLTEAQEKEILNKRYEYTDHDVAELALLASAIEALAYVSVGYYLNQSNAETDHCLTILNTIEILAKPVAHFLNEGAPMAEKETESAKEN